METYVAWGNEGPMRARPFRGVALALLRRTAHGAAVPPENTKNPAKALPGAAEDQASHGPPIIIPPVDSVGFLLSDVSRLLRKGFDRRVRSLGLTRAQWHVLVYVLENQGSSQSNLARLMDLERAPLGQLVRALENLRLVRRERSHTDQREWLVFGGAAAHAILPQLVEAAIWLRDLSEQNISPVESALLRRLLEQMRTNLSRELE